MSEQEPEINDGTDSDKYPYATMDEIRVDLRKRSEQAAAIVRKLQSIAYELHRLETELSQVEALSPGGKRRRRRRGSMSAAKGPSVIEIAVEILESKGAPMPCTDLARAVLARGVNSGNNERSLRMSASKGKKLKSLPGDVIALP